MKRLTIRAVFFVFLFITPAFAETTMKAEVNKTRITTDETLTYKITIISTDKSISKPQIPKFEGFNAISQLQSSNISFVKAGIKTTLVYTFILSPADTGKFKIEPSHLKIRNKTYSTDSFEIEVIQGKARPMPKSKETPRQPEEILPETEEPQITL